MDGALIRRLEAARRRHLHPGNLNPRMTDLLSPMTLVRGPAWKNRFMLAPLTNLQSHPDGRLSDEEFHWLTFRANGGFGLVMTCAAHVQRIGKGFPGQLGVFSDDHLPGLTRLAAEIKAEGSVELGAAAPRRHPLARGADRREAGRPQRGRRDRRPRALHRRGRAAGRGLHRRRGARREGRLRRRRAARRARLHPLRLPQPRHQPARPTATAARPENRARIAVRHHQGRPRPHPARLPARPAHLARALRPGVRRAAGAGRAAAGLGRPRLPRHVAVGLRSSRRSTRPTRAGR